MAPTNSPFLDLLPPEMRLYIYSFLLVTPQPIKGTIARQDAKYNLHTAILRTNRQINDEARSVFFGKNTFCISSVPPAPSTTSVRNAAFNSEDQEEEDTGSGAFEPPLQLRDLPLVRHLEIDLLYYPRSLRTTWSAADGGWKPTCVGAERYIASLFYILRCVESSLLSLSLCADMRPYSASRTPELEDPPLSPTKLLTGFHAADTSPRFKAALAALPIDIIPLRFDFPESHFDFCVEKRVLLRESLVFLAGQVLLARSEIRLKALLGEMGGDDGEGEGEGMEVKEGRVVIGLEERWGVWER
ncbi:hypothetical protein IQ07DRAFT_567186 [Pyrenochaeta sp. DS3sAY3a]|nr:hypothetical protein IQ07DRAFT_567186 [Pyrenochaeta sp. DS3sAY3a]